MEERLKEVAEFMNQLRAEKIIRNPSKIQQATAGQIIINPTSGEFIARPIKR